MTNKVDVIEILQIIQKALAANQLYYSKHALERMEEREISVAEIKEIIKYGKAERRLDEFDKGKNYWRYAIRNEDIAGRDLAISVDIEGHPNVVIVTAMQIDPFTARSL